MPDLEFNFVMASVNYPGSTAEDIEILIVEPIENALKGLSGIDEVRSTATKDRATIDVRITKTYPLDEVYQEIKDAIDSVNLPDDAHEPRYRRFRTSEKAVIDIGLFFHNARVLDVNQRALLQEKAVALENKILALKEVSKTSRTGYHKPQVQIQIDPAKLLTYNVSISEVINQIKNHEIRLPAGSIEDKNETNISLVLENRIPDDYKKLVIRSGFEGSQLLLGQLANIQYGFSEKKSIRKIQGHEGIILRVSKSTVCDILTATTAIKEIVEKHTPSFRASGVELIVMDDESYDIRNRLKIISTNGSIGFVLILFTLFIFLDFRSGIWVALGIPFTMAFTVLFSYFLGYTVNNVTLSAIIIVMGMVVDDAIIVAENISRCRSMGMGVLEASVNGAAKVFLPVTASIATTCAAFAPFFFFSGHFGMFVKYIPIIIFLMLSSSLLESFLILPSHLSTKIPGWIWAILSLGITVLIAKLSRKDNKKKDGHWFWIVENAYGKFLLRALKFRWIIIISFIGLLGLAGLTFIKKMKFVMFPREEVSQLFLIAKAREGTNRYETERLARPVEDIILKEMSSSLIALRSDIAIGRRGREVHENEIRFRIELLPTQERRKSSRQLIKQWNQEFKNIKGFEEIRFIRPRWGHASGSAIEVIVKENNDNLREKIAMEIFEVLDNHPNLKEAQIERTILNPQVKFNLNQGKMMQLGINALSVAGSVRTFLQGSVLYDFIKDDQNYDVVLTSKDKSKESLQKVLKLPVENKQRYLVQLHEIVTVKPEDAPKTIKRRSFKRALMVYADLKDKKKVSPLEIAAYLEREIFPEISRKYPSANVGFLGEVANTRESQAEFLFAAIIILGLIYGILTLLFHSFFKPLLILIIIPFGAVGVIFAFLGHGLLMFGFFAVVGALGMLGVVVNDSIVLIHKLENEYGNGAERGIKAVAMITKTRLRAVLLTTFTTIAGLFPTAYGIAGYDSMLAEMMLSMGWGLLFGTMITLLLVPSCYSIYRDVTDWWEFRRGGTKSES